MWSKKNENGKTRFLSDRAWLCVLEFLPENTLCVVRSVSTQLKRNVSKCHKSEKSVSRACMQADASLKLLHERASKYLATVVHRSHLLTAQALANLRTSALKRLS